MISYIIISVISVLLVAADQVTKYLVSEKLTGAITVIPNFFEITYVRNTGAAWGIFSDGTLALGILSAVCVCLIIFLYVQADSSFLKLCLGLLIAGASGNLIDRFRLRYVVDFLNFYNLFGYEFPVFNVADICVTAGAVGLLIYLLFLARKHKAFRDGTLCAKFFGDEKKHVQ